MTVMILLMGEQPAANLLPARRYQPETILLVHTTRTQDQAVRFARVMTGASIVPLVVDAFRIVEIAEAIREAIVQNGWHSNELLFNLTGGTKTMSLAAYDVAQSLDAPILYFQSSGASSRLYRYSFESGRHVQLVAEEELAETISLDEYLSLYLDGYTAHETCQSRPSDTGRALEIAAGAALREAGYEVRHNLCPSGEGNIEVDLAFRQGNQVGVMEAKLSAGKKAIDQLMSLAAPQYLGTYIKRVIVSTKELDRNNANLAAAHRISVVVLPAYERHDLTLTPTDATLLVQTVDKAMGIRRS